MDASSVPLYSSEVYSEEIPQEVHRDVSTRETLSSQPLVPDLYEWCRVEVGKSKISAPCRRHLQLSRGILSRFDLGAP